MNFLLAPIYTFFSKTLYQNAGKEKAGKGFLYLLYVTLLVTVVMAGMIQFVMMPAADEFVNWVKKEMPVLTLSQDGLSMDREDSYTMVHPLLGPLVTFDFSKTELAPMAEKHEQVFVTKDKIYVHENAQTRIYPLKEILEKNPRIKEQSVTLDADGVDKIYKTAKPTFTAFMLLGTLLGFYVWKVLVALFYTLFGMLFNKMRSTPFSYGQLLNVTIYALTPAAIFQVLRMVIPALGAVPFLFVLDISMTLAYLYFGIKMSENIPMRNHEKAFTS